MLVATGDKNDRNWVFFKFASESDVLEKVEFIGHQIAVGDLRHAIAARKNLPPFDISIVNEATGEVYEKNGKMLPRNMCVVVRRTPLHNSKKQAILHVENADVWDGMREGGKRKLASGISAEPPVPIQKRAFPPEYLCPLCRDIFNAPVIARCCGRSACSACFEQRGHACPLCSRDWDEDTRPVPNRSLADSVASLNLDYFVLPSEVRRAEAEAEARAAAAASGGTAPGARGAAAGAYGGVPPNGAVPGQAVTGPPPPGMVVRPVMLTPEQFFAWQQSLRAGGSESDSSSEERRRRKKKKSKEKSKKSKRPRQE